MNDDNTQSTSTEGSLPPTDIATFLSAFKIKLDAANAQILQLGLLVEFLYKEIEENKILNLEGYPKWAQDRFKEIQEMANTPENKKIQEEMRSEMEEIAKNINLT